MACIRGAMTNRGPLDKRCPNWQHYGSHKHPMGSVGVHVQATPSTHPESKQRVWATTYPWSNGVSLWTCLCPRHAGWYRLLVLDDHGSHLTPQFHKACNDTIAICVLPHSSHLLQPLDAGCFEPLKRAYGSYTRSKSQLGINHIDKLDFLEMFLKADQEVFKPHNIQSGFSATGICPSDPEWVLTKLNISLATPTPYTPL